MWFFLPPDLHGHVEDAAPSPQILALLKDSPALSLTTSSIFQIICFFLGTGQGTLLGTADMGSKGPIHHHVPNTPWEHQERASFIML